MYPWWFNDPDTFPLSLASAQVLSTKPVLHGFSRDRSSKLIA